MTLQKERRFRLCQHSPDEDLSFEEMKMHVMHNLGTDGTSSWALNATPAPAVFRRRTSVDSNPPEQSHTVTPMTPACAIVTKGSESTQPSAEIPRLKPRLRKAPSALSALLLSQPGSHESSSKSPRILEPPNTFCSVSTVSSTPRQTDSVPGSAAAGTVPNLMTLPEGTSWKEEGPRSLLTAANESDRPTSAVSHPETVMAEFAGDESPPVDPFPLTEDFARSPSTTLSPAMNKENIDPESPARIDTLKHRCEMSDDHHSILQPNCDANEHVSPSMRYDHEVIVIDDSCEPQYNDEIISSPLPQLPKIPRVSCSPEIEGVVRDDFEACVPFTPVTQKGQTSGVRSMHVVTGHNAGENQKYRFRARVIDPYSASSRKHREQLMLRYLIQCSDANGWHRITKSGNAECDISKIFAGAKRFIPDYVASDYNSFCPRAAMPKRELIFGELLGRGAEGKVHLAEIKRQSEASSDGAGKTVAIKVQNGDVGTCVRQLYCSSVAQQRAPIVLQRRKQKLRMLLSENGMLASTQGRWPRQSSSHCIPYPITQDSENWTVPCKHADSKFPSAGSVLWRSPNGATLMSQCEALNGISDFTNRARGYFNGEEQTYSGRHAMAALAGAGSVWLTPFEMVYVSRTKDDIGSIMSNEWMNESDAIQRKQPSNKKTMCYLIMPALQQSKSLLNFLNEEYVSRGERMPEVLVLYITYQILDLVAQIHELGLIHADIKIDNFLVYKTDSDGPDMAHNAKHPLVANDGVPFGIAGVDFGRCLDVQDVYDGCLFAGDHHVAGLKPPAMLQRRPWMHSIDLFGIASVVYCLLSGKHMQVRPGAPCPNEHGCVPAYITTGTPIKRYHRFGSVWARLFDQLINFGSHFHVDGPAKERIDNCAPQVAQQSLEAIRSLQFEIECLFASDQKLRESLSEIMINTNLT